MTVFLNDHTENSTHYTLRYHRPGRRTSPWVFCRRVCLCLCVCVSLLQSVGIFSTSENEVFKYSRSSRYPKALLNMSRTIKDPRVVDTHTRNVYNIMSYTRPLLFDFCRAKLSSLRRRRRQRDMRSNDDVLLYSSAPPTSRDISVVEYLTG